MRLIFMGTPEPAAKVLQALIAAGHEIAAVVTQPDRPSGRGQKLAFSAVKELALQNNLPLEQPEKIKGNKVFAALIKSLAPEVIVVVAYGKILPREILDIPKFGCLNVHASLLPKYRGAAPVQWALLKGEAETGITIMKLDELLDTGDILLQEKVQISDEDTTQTLLEKLFTKAGPLLLKALEQLEKGSANFIKQKDSDATNAPSIQKEAGELNWQKSSLDLHSRIRAMIPWPGAHTFFKGKLLKIWRAKPIAAGSKNEPGTILEIVKDQGFVVATANGNLLVLEVQPAGKKRMSAFQFAIGHDVKPGKNLPS
ncbi:MAG: methionyl-tRNA formyltransferase [bacterium]